MNNTENSPNEKSSAPASQTPAASPTPSQGARKPAADGGKAKVWYRDKESGEMHKEPGRRK